MTWTKTPDDYPERLLELSDAAYRLHHAATTICNRLLSDGRLSRARLALVAVPPRTKRRATVRELVEAGLWHEDRDGWDLLDFLDWQLSREEIEASRAYDAARQAVRYARSKNETDTERAVSKTNEERARANLYAVRERRRAALSQRESQRDSQRPVPTRPDPNEVEDGKPAYTKDTTNGREAPRRVLARAIREAPDGTLRARHVARFENSYGHLYPKSRRVAS